MYVWGIILGGAAGFAIGGPIGALVGSAIGLSVDQVISHALEPAGDARADDVTHQTAFTIGVIALGAKMARADGDITADEVAAFNRVFRVPPEAEPRVRGFFDLAKRSSAGYEAYARQLRHLLSDRPDVLEQVLDCLFHIAEADGHVTETEFAFLRGVAHKFGLDDTAFEAWRRLKPGPAEHDPWTILGVARDATPEVIKAAYRALVRRHHPDRLMGEGLPAPFVGVASARLATINGAYAEIARLKGLR
jgi:DnaJ like chaperone protein